MLFCKVDLNVKVLVLEEILDFIGLEAHWQHSVLEAVVVKNVRKGRRNYCSEPIVKYCPNRMLAGAAATKVLSRNHDPSARIFWAVQHKLFSWLAVTVKAPVVKQVLAKAIPVDKLQELLWHYLVGVDIDPIKWGRPAS